jgi:hypothetical protein
VLKDADGSGRRGNRIGGHMLHYTPIEIAHLSVNAIINDLADRAEFRQVWKELDEDIQREIRSAWEGNVLRILLPGTH